MSPTFHPGQRIRLKEPDARGARYFTLLHKRWSGWYAHTALPDHGWQPIGHDAVIAESQMEPVPTPWKRYGRLPWGTWWKLLASVPLGWLLMHANRRYRTTAFYELKDQVLRKFGRADGCDLQVLPPKPCWSCDGSGRELTWSKETGKRVPYADGRKCYDCNRTGEYQGKLYVRLERRKLAWFTFHKPTGTTYCYEQAVALWMPRSEIAGLIMHNPRPKWLGYWCRIALKLLFDFPRFGPHFLRVSAHNTRWRLQGWTAPLRRKLGLSLSSDEDQLPF